MHMYIYVLPHKILELDGLVLIEIVGPHTLQIVYCYLCECDCVPAKT